MQVKQEEVKKNRIKLEIALTSEEFEAGMSAAYQKNKNRFVIPGFRKGKAPQKRVEAVYGRGVLYEDAVNDLIPVYYDKAVEELKLEPVAQPEVDLVNLDEAEAPLTFTAEVDVKPEVTLGDYKNLGVEKVVYELKEEEVEERLKTVQSQNARHIPTEEAAVVGNIVNIDFEGFKDGVAFAGGKGTHDLELGSGQFIPGFEDQLVGVKAGEDRDVNLSFPEDYHAAELAGAPVTFKVHVNEVKIVELPEIDDEFAQEVSTCETLEEYKGKIREELTLANTSRAEREYKEAIIEKAAENAEMDIPQSMIDNDASALRQDFQNSLQYSGLTMEQWLAYNDTTEEGMDEQFQKEAVKNIRSRLTIEAIGKAENIEVSDDDVKAEIQKIADSYGRPLEEVERIYGGSMGETLRLNLMWDKTIDFIVAANQAE